MPMGLADSAMISTFSGQVEGGGGRRSGETWALRCAGALNAPGSDGGGEPGVETWSVSVSLSDAASAIAIWRVLVISSNGILAGC